MNRTILVANHQFTVTTKEWAFDEDERQCIDLIEASLRALSPLDLERAWKTVLYGDVSSDVEAIVHNARQEATGGFAAPASAIVTVYADLRREVRARQGVN